MAEKLLGEVALAELWALVKAEDAKAPKIATGSYVGTGVYNNHTMSLTFDGEPVMVLLQKDGENISPGSGNWGRYSLIFFKNNTSGSIWDTLAENSVGLSYTMTSKTLSWYIGNNTFSQPRNLLNESGVTYKWVAFLM